MTDPTAQTNWTDRIGADVVDADGAKIGKLTDVYTDDDTGQPAWLLVKTGLLGAKDSFVPVAGATSDGAVVRVPHPKALVKDAPRVAGDNATLTPDERAQLGSHYGNGLDAGTVVGRAGGPSDHAMTRSEEELVAGTQRRAVTRARLTRYIVTEDVTLTVPVRKEMVRLEYEPIVDGDVEPGRFADRTTVGDGPVEMILREEEVVIERRIVPRERVRLETFTVVEHETVSDEIRKERIDVEGDVPGADT